MINMVIITLEVVILKNKKYLILVLLLTICLPFGCSTKPSKEEIKPEASSTFKKGNVNKVKVLNDDCNIYNGNTTKHTVIDNVNEGDIVDVYGFSKDWYIVVLEDGRLGAISPKNVAPYIKEVSTSEANASIKNLNPNEEEIARYVNGERIKRGLNPLKVDKALTALARDKSTDIVEYNYFSHYSPTYGSPFDMLSSYNVPYIYAGENLAGNTSLSMAHKQLMDSEGHRKNILSKNFTHIGIGVKEGSKYGKIITQIFVGR